MASSVLLETKLHAPRRRGGVVARPRLAGRLDPLRLPALTLVSAPAGFGKTTLLAEWLAGRAGGAARIAWVSLDGRDNDPWSFWSYLVAAARAAVPELSGASASILEGSTSSMDDLVATLSNDLWAVTGEVVVVLDDYHVIESPEIHEAVRFLVEHLPAHVHLVLAARADPPWPLAGLRARGELLELRAADLRFDPQEAAAYLNDAMGLGLIAADVDVLAARTEGWITALQLAALSMQSRGDVAGFIAGFAGDDRFILDYLVDEVLDQQSDTARAFLLQTSVLGRLSASLCEAVTGRDDGKAMLGQLERANMFLVPLDDRRVWYRYHHLFADALQARLLDEHPDLVAELHRRASAWFEQHGERGEAIRHALAGRDFARAADLVELAGPAMRQVRQEATLRTWFDALPAEIYADRPVLTISWVGARMSSGELDGVEAQLAAVERWLDPTSRPPGAMVAVDEAELARLPAQTAMYRAALSLLAGDIPGTMAHAGRALGLTADDDHVGLGAAHALLGLAHWTDGDLGPAEDRYADSIECFRRAEHHADILGCARVLADIQVGRGRLGTAIRTLESGLELARDHGPLRGTADMHAALAEILRERNELEAARAHVEASREMGEHLALPQNAHRWRIGLARLLQIDGALADALDLLADAGQVYDSDYSPPIRPVPAVAARMHLAAGDLEAALRWVESRGVAVDDPLSYLHEYEHLTLARVLLARHATEPDRRALDDAAMLLDRLRNEAEAGGRTGSVVEILALRALVHQAASRPGPAMAVLEEALRLAQPEGFVRLFLDEGPPMLALLRVAARTGPAPALAQRLLAAEAPSVRRPPLAPPAASGLVDPLSDRELQVLRLLRSELSGPEIARELMVSLNTMRTHTKNIYMKLGVSSRRAAVRRAAELGL